ncbi:hypothetical protein K438DRAFT_1963193 [Mycena galopus ATCC 62051]|nr:hypothetical protein K438DRAFT_1963193 [Mycena galopus ATCC 62051]
MLFNSAVLSVLDLTGSTVAAPHRRPKAANGGFAAGTTAQATAAVAEAFGRRDFDLSGLLASLRAQAQQAAQGAAAGQGAGGFAAGTTVIATGPNMSFSIPYTQVISRTRPHSQVQATAVSINGGPAFGRRQIDIGDILSSLEAQANGALATRIAGAEAASAADGDFTSRPASGPPSLRPHLPPRMLRNTADDGADAAGDDSTDAADQTAAAPAAADPAADPKGHSGF